MMRKTTTFRTKDEEQTKLAMFRPCLTYHAHQVRNVAARDLPRRLMNHAIYLIWEGADCGDASEDAYYGGDGE